MEDMEIIEDEESRATYFFDLDWFKENNRSFPVVVQSRLCPACQKKRDQSGESAAQADDSQALLENIRTCCSQSQDFFPDGLPLMDAIFRVFLTSQEPVDLEELHQQLKTRMGVAGDRRDISVKTLERLLQKDGSYGLRRVIAPLEEGQEDKR